MGFFFIIFSGNKRLRNRFGYLACWFGSGLNKKDTGLCTNYESAGSTANRSVEESSSFVWSVWTDTDHREIILQNYKNKKEILLGRHDNESEYPFAFYFIRKNKFSIKEYISRILSIKGLYHLNHPCFIYYR